MVNISNKGLCFLILALLISAGIYYKSQTNTQQQIVPIQSDNPTYTSNQMISRVYNINGKLNYKLQANHVEYYADQNEATFQAPMLTLFDTQSKASWQINAEQAKLVQPHQLFLIGHVDVLNLSQDSYLDKIKGTDITINLINHDISSDSKVTIMGSQLQSSGRKLQGNLEKKTTKILDDVITTYGASYD